MLDKHLKKYLLALLALAALLGVWIVPFEAEHKIKTLNDGLWWAITTVTGVGYGDVVPVTGWGRLIGVLLMTVGLVLFSSVVALLSSKLMKAEEKYHRLRQQKTLDSLNNKLFRLEKKLDYLIKEKK
jgi:voltage-gated potassium channel